MTLHGRGNSTNSFDFGVVQSVGAALIVTERVSTDLPKRQYERAGYHAQTYYGVHTRLSWWISAIAATMSRLLLVC